MNLCDRCVHNKPLAVIKVDRKTPDGQECVATTWELCEDCATEVWQAVTKEAGRRVCKKLEEFCPSLTPEQTRAVEQYIMWRSKQ